MRAPTAIGLLAVILSSCGSDDSPVGSQPPSTTEPPATTEPPPVTTEPVRRPIEFELPTDPDAVVLRYDVGVNQPDPFAMARSLPPYSLYADGRLVIVERQGRSGPPEVVQVRMSPDATRRLVERAINAGALQPPQPQTTPVDEDGYELADVDVGVYEIAVASSNQEFDEMTGAGAVAGEVEQILRDFQTAGRKLEDRGPYVPERIIVLDFLYDEELQFLPLDEKEEHETRAGDLSCIELSGEAAQEVVALSDDPDALARSYGIYVYRPLLPDEPGCQTISER